MLRAGFKINDLPKKYQYLERRFYMTNSSLKSKIDLNDLVHLNSYFITKKISDSQFIRVNFTLEF